LLDIIVDMTERSIFEIFESDFQLGDIVWAKFNGQTWWER